MSFGDMKMGLKPPEGLEKQLAIQEDIREMRKAITFGQRDSNLINRCLRVAEHMGLSSEETMVLLAYNALVQLEGMWQTRLKLSALDIRAPFFAKEPPDQLSDEPHGW